MVNMEEVMDEVEELGAWGWDDAAAAVGSWREGAAWSCSGLLIGPIAVERGV